MADDLRNHWEGVYRAKAPTEVSWYQPEARLSLELIRRVAPDLDAPVVVFQRWSMGRLTTAIKR